MLNVVMLSVVAPSLEHLVIAIVIIVDGATEKDSFTQKFSSHNNKSCFIN
jgi:hypothetical protein